MLPKDQEVKPELERRLTLWGELKARGGPDGIEPNALHDLGIYRGGRGVYRDLDTTALVPGADPDIGIAVGLLHTGKVYADDLSEDGVTYHYPVTSVKGRDANEIAAMKACGDLGLPVFVIIKPEARPRHRNVRFGWVQEYDDKQSRLYITFSDTEQPPTPLVGNEESTLEPFVLQGKRTFKLGKTKVRPHQGRFRFRTMKQYGIRCAVCGIQQEALLEAAHLCPVEKGGCDDPRNGLVFCLTHHRAFDKGLFGIDPETLRIQIRAPGKSPQELAITRESIDYLRKHPHREALQWAWVSRAPKEQKGKQKR